MALRKVLLNISAAALVTAVLIAFLLSGVLRKRLLSIVKGIKSVAKGEYAYRIETKSSDEFDELAKEFNIFADRLEQTEMVRQRFVSDASHELKTPLAGIRLLTDSIIQNEDIPPELQREFVLDIGREAERLTRITEKLLALTRLDFKREEEVHPVDVKTVIIEAMKMLSMLASNKGVTLQCELDDGCIIIANSDDIHEIVFNLVENAIKYNVENGTVRIILYAKDDRVHIIIDDTGIGIPEEDIPHIFDRFYRVDKSRTNEIGGSGLGLAIVKDTVEKHAGIIKVQRREAGGTRFELSFPLYGGKEAAK
jgi:signal transduction histidine kinase